MIKYSRWWQEKKVPPIHSQNKRLAPLISFMSKPLTVSIIFTSGTGGNEAEAERLTSDTYFKALAAFDRYEERGQGPAWILTIARNTLKNRHRDEKRRQKRGIVSLDARPRPHSHSQTTFGEIVAGPSQDPEKILERKQEQRGILEAVRKLPVDRQELLILKFSEGMKNKEIAEIMGRTEGAIKSLYHRTLNQLRRNLEKG